MTPHVVPLPERAPRRRMVGRRRERVAFGRDSRRGGRGDAGVPPGRRPAPHPLAVDRAARRADGAPRGATVAEPRRGARSTPRPARISATARCRRSSGRCPRRRRSACTCPTPGSPCASSVTRPARSCHRTRRSPTPSTASLLDVVAVQQASRAEHLSPWHHRATTRRRRGDARRHRRADERRRRRAAVARIRARRPAVGIALVLDTASWTTLARAPPRCDRALPRRLRRARRRWMASPAGKAGDDLAQLWSASGVGSSASTGRAARLAAVSGQR